MLAKFVERDALALFASTSIPQFTRDTPRNGATVREPKTSSCMAQEAYWRHLQCEVVLPALRAR